MAEHKVYPIPGRLVVGEPMEFDEKGAPVARAVDSKEEADRLVATGGFAHTEKDAAEAAFTTPPGEEASTDNLKVQPEPEEPPAAAAAPEKPDKE